MNLALVYDRINKIGGAERVLQAIHEKYPESPLYTAVYDPQKAVWAADFEIKTSFLNNLPLAKSNHELYPWLTPLAFESFDFSGFDVVLSITSAEAKGILTRPQTLHLCYCLTPTRYLWNAYDTYLAQIPRPLRPLTKPVFSYLKNWDLVASQRPDVYLTISKTVQKRIKYYYGRESEVIYPPVDYQKFSTQAKKNISLPFDNYYLIVSRLVPYKKIELAIKACNYLGKKLVIVGTGVQQHILKKKSGSSVYFTGQLTESDLVLYYQRCKALIFPQEEDFGISLVEAQAAGKAVIAFNKGGAKEILTAGKTGIFFSRQTAPSLIQALLKFEQQKINPDLCRSNAKQYDKKIFISKFSKFLEEQWKKHQKKFQ